MSEASSPGNNEDPYHVFINDEIQTQPYPDSPLDNTHWESSQKHHELPLESSDSSEDGIDVGEEKTDYITCSRIPLSNFDLPINPNNFSIGDLPFTTHSAMDPRAAAAIIGMQALSNVDVLGDISGNTLKNMSKYPLNKSETKKLLKDPIAMKQIKETTLELLIEQGRKSFIYEALQNFSKTRICFGYLKDYLDAENFKFDQGITKHNYLSDDFIKTFTGIPFLPQIMKFEDQQMLFNIICEIRDRTFYPTKSPNKKFKH